MEPSTAIVPYVEAPASPVLESIPLDDNVVKKLEKIRKEIFCDFTGVEEGTVAHKNPFSDNSTAKIYSEKFATALAHTFGSQMSNRAIAAACAVLYPKPLTDPSWYEKLTNTGTHAAVNALTVGAQLAITPYLLPFLPLISSGLVGTGVAGVSLLLSAAYAGCCGREKTVVFPSIDELVRYDEQKGFIDPKGTPYTSQDLDDMFHTMMKFNLVCKLQECKRDQVADVINQYVQLIEEDKNLNENIKFAIRQEAEVLIGRVAGHAFVNYTEIRDSISLITKFVARRENKKFCLTSPQMLKISEAFDNMKMMLQVPQLTPQDKLDYNNSTNQLCIRNHWRITCLIKGLTTENTALQLKEKLGAALVEQFKLVDAELDKLKDIDPDVVDFINAQIKSTFHTFEAFFKEVGHAHKGDCIQKPTIELINLFNEKIYQLEMKLMERLEAKGLKFLAIESKKIELLEASNVLRIKDKESSETVTTIDPEQKS